MSWSDKLWSNEGQKLGAITGTVGGTVTGAVAGSVVGTLLFPIGGTIVGGTIGGALGGTVGGALVGVSGMFVGSQIGDLLYEKKKPVPRIIISGPPGCGKGTQSDLICKKFGVVQVSTGDLIRNKMKEKDSKGEKTELAKKLSNFVEMGELVPDELVNPIFLEAITRTECRDKGWILDGYPRNPSHFEYMRKHGIQPNIVICITISDKLSLQRQTGKILDDKGRIFHLKFLPPPLNTKYEQMESDKNIKSAETRLEVFHNYLQDFQHWYPDQYVVDGDQKVEDVFQKIRDFIKSKLTK